MVPVEDMWGTGQVDRARGALWGLALGDALGMPTQTLTREQIRVTYGRIDSLRDATADQPVSHGMPAGSVTDDTEQALLLGDLLVEGHGRVPPGRLAAALVAWERDMRTRNADDLLGPSTRRAIDAILAGADPRTSGRHGNTNGAAMRIAPVGIAWPPGPSGDLVAAVHAVSLPTHDTPVALAGAAAIAAAVSSGVEGRALTESIGAALDAARQAEHLGAPAATPSLPDRLEWALARGPGLPDPQFEDFVADEVGTSVRSEESVVAALVISDRFGDDLWGALCLAARLGDDTDTMGAMCGAVLGAHTGVAGIPQGPREQVAVVSGLDVDALVDGLLALRWRPRAQRADAGGEKSPAPHRERAHRERTGPREPDRDGAGHDEPGRDDA